MLGQPLAAQLGGGPSTWQIELQALLDAYSPGWSDANTTENYAEVEALALGVTMIWACNQRRADWLVPERMMESLPIFEQACQIRPLPTATVQERRAAIAARFLGFAGNALANIYRVCQAIAGQVFLGFSTDPNPTNYMPGLNPGPPGFEASSARAVLGIQLVRTGLPDATFMDLVRRLRVELNQLAPVWGAYSIGTEEGGAVPDIAIPDITIVEA